MPLIRGKKASDGIIRCTWSFKTPDDPMIPYHDEVWGVPEHDDHLLFEHFSLCGAQAGLTWKAIYLRWAFYREAFDQFDPARVARYDERKIEKLLQNEGIIRNRQKVNSVVTNAKRILEVKKEFGSFDKFIWQFTGGKPKINKWKTSGQIPATSKESDAMSAELKKRGFSFAGSTICYAFMQQTGMVNDHTVDCFRYKSLQKLK